MSLAKFPIFSEFLFGQICQHLTSVDISRLLTSFGITQLAYSFPIYSKIDQRSWILPEINPLTLQIAVSLQKQGMNSTFLQIIEEGRDGCDILLKMGASPNIIDNRRTTTLMYAILYNRTKLVKALIISKTDVHLRDNFGNTAITLAAGKGSSEILKYLLEAGANVNERDGWESTPLINACCNSVFSFETVQILLKYPNVEINARNNAGFTALICASRAGRLKTVKLLEEAGAIQ